MSEVVEQESKQARQQLDLGRLLYAAPDAVVNTKALKKRKEPYLTEVAENGTQMIINRMFELPSVALPDVIGRVVNLPAPTYVIPREKSLPAQKVPTKWEEFAKLKGIGKNKKRDKQVWDEDHQEYRRRYGVGRVNDGSKQWMVEAQPGEDLTTDPFNARKKEKKARVAKNEKQRKANLERAAAPGDRVPGTLDLTTLVQPDKTKKNQKVKQKHHTDVALAVAQRSTPSLGKFDKLQYGEQKLKAQPKPEAAQKKREVRTSFKAEKNQSMHVLNKMFSGQGESERFDMNKAVNQNQVSTERDRWNTQKSHKKRKKNHD